MPYLQWSFWIIGLGLQFLVVAALLNGPWREYRTVFFYSCFAILSTVTDIVMGATINPRSRPYLYYFWSCELIRQTGLYAVVVSLVTHALPDNRLRATLIKMLIILAMIFWVGSIYIQEGPKFSLWMSKVVRNLSFGSSIANLSLWFTLIAAEKKEARLLMITGGLGLSMTGDAIGQSLRQVSKAFTLPGDIIIVLTHFLCLYIWWQAFQQKTGAMAPILKSEPEHDLEESQVTTPDAGPH